MRTLAEIRTQFIEVPIASVEYVLPSRLRPASLHSLFSLLFTTKMMWGPTASARNRRELKPSGIGVATTSTHIITRWLSTFSRPTYMLLLSNLWGASSHSAKSDLLPRCARTMSLRRNRVRGKADIKKVTWVGRIKKGGRNTMSGMLIFIPDSPCGTARVQSTVLKRRP